MPKNKRKLSKGSIAMNSPVQNGIIPDESKKYVPAQDQHKSDNTNNDPKPVSIRHFFYFLS